MATEFQLCFSCHFIQTLSFSCDTTFHIQNTQEGSCRFAITKTAITNCEGVQTDFNRLDPKKRTKPTPSPHVIEKTVENFLTQWKSVEYDGTRLIPQIAIGK